MKVAVLGGGIIGLACAHELEKGGAEVALVERDRVGEGCSFGNGGWVCPSLATPLPAPGLLTTSLRWLGRPESPLYIKPSVIPRLAPWLLAFRRHCNASSFRDGLAALADLAEPCVERYRDLRAAGVAFEWAESGMLLAHERRERLAEEHALIASLADHGVGPVELLDRDALFAREHALSGDLVGGLHVHGEGHVRPDTLCAGLEASLRSRDVRILEGFEVRSLAASGDRVSAARGSAGAVDADAFIVATGAECGRLAGLAGRPLPVQAGKGYSITIRGPDVRLAHPLFLDGAKVGFTPFEGAVRILGTMEFSGINRNLDRRRLRILESAARRFVPGLLDAGERSDWVGMRPVTPDGLPIIGPLPGVDNVWVATGHQMLGVTLALPTGKLVADLVLGRTPAVDPVPFRVDRF